LLNGMTRQTLRDWCIDTTPKAWTDFDPGRSRSTAFSERRAMEELREMVLKGPDPVQHTVIRWRCVDLCKEIAERWSVNVCEQTMGKWLRGWK